MDYFKIVMMGYAKTQPKYLSEYFIREQKKSATEFFGVEEFFDGCRAAADHLSSAILRLQDDKEAYLKRQIRIAQENGDKTIEDQCIYSLEMIKSEVFFLNLMDYTNGTFSGDIGKRDVEIIKEAIEEAYKSLSNLDSNNDDLIIKPQKLENRLTLKQVNLLYKGLLKQKNIAEDTDKESFIWAFGCRSEIIHYKPIRWIGPKNLCAYFVESYNDIVLKSKQYKNRNKIKVFEGIFNINGLGGAMNDYKKTGVEPNHHTEIDKLLKDMLRE